MRSADRLSMTAYDFVLAVWSAKEAQVIALKPQKATIVIVQEATAIVSDPLAANHEAFLKFHEGELLPSSWISMPAAMRCLF